MNNGFGKKIRLTAKLLVKGRTLNKVKLNNSFVLNTTFFFKK